LDDEEDVTVLATNPRNTTLTGHNQGWWRAQHPDKWPAIRLALEYFRNRLIRYNPFGDNETLRTYAIAALEDVFQDYKPFQVQHSMLEMVWCYLFHLFILTLILL
jgi:hypothetical protein